MPYAGPGDKPSLGGGAWIVSVHLLFSHIEGPWAGSGEFLHQTMLERFGLSISAEKARIALL